MIYQKGRLVDEIIVHCAATHPNWMSGHPLAAKVAEITRWHKARGFRTIGYHRIIDRDGKVMQGRPFKEIGAHVRGHNTGTIGICLLGGHGGAATDEFSDHFTKAQEKALRAEVAKIKKLTAIKRVSGHNEYAAKACPCFNVPAFFAAPAPKAKPAPKAMRPWWKRFLGGQR